MNHESLRPDNVSREAEYRRQQAIASAIMTQYHRLHAMGLEPGADPIAIDQANLMVGMIQQSLLASRCLEPVDLSAYWRTDAAALPLRSSSVVKSDLVTPSLHFLALIQGKAVGAQLNATLLALLQRLGVTIEHALPHDEDPDRG